MGALDNLRSVIMLALVAPPSRSWLAPRAFCRLAWHRVQHTCTHANPRLHRCPHSHDRAYNRFHECNVFLQNPRALGQHPFSFRDCARVRTCVPHGEMTLITAALSCLCRISPAAALSCMCRISPAALPALESPSLTRTRAHLAHMWANAHTHYWLSTNAGETQGREMHGTTAL